MFAPQLAFITTLDLVTLGITGAQLAQGVAGTCTQEQALINQTGLWPLSEGTDVGPKDQYSKGFQIGPSPENAGVLRSSGTPVLWRPRANGRSPLLEHAATLGETPARARTSSRRIGLYTATGGLDDASAGGVSTPVLRNTIPAGAVDFTRYSVDQILQGLGGIGEINKHRTPFDDNLFYGKKLTGEQVKELYARGVRNFAGANLRGVSLAGASLEKIQLVGANLRRADLTKSYLAEASLVGADLRGASLAKAYLKGADLRWADLTGANLENAHLAKTTLARASLRKAVLRGTVLELSNLMGADLSRADLSGASLRWASLRRTILKRANLKGADLTSAVLSGADLRKADLRGAHLGATQLYGTDLRGARLTEDTILILARTDQYTKF